MNFPDLPHLRQLQKDLWQWPKSRAAVMVGAGLSLTAEPLPGARTRFSTWRELVRAMFDETHPAQVGATLDQAKDREDRFNRANPLRLASEYEAAFGRQKLDQIVRRLNPDSDYLPGKLHHLLLQLPWVDVFTTNYDTLLERTGRRTNIPTGYKSKRVDDGLRSANHKTPRLISVPNSIHYHRGGLSNLSTPICTIRQFGSAIIA